MGPLIIVSLIMGSGFLAGYLLRDREERRRMRPLRQPRQG
jgi:hypothetical protein